MNSATKQTRDPWIAVNLSVLWPGIGQCYGNAWNKGVLLAITVIILLGFASWSILGANGNTLTGIVIFLAIGIIYITSVFDSYNTLKPLPKPSLAVYQPSQNRWYAVFLSQILPGFGHLYVQHSIVGGILLASGTMTSLLANEYSALLPFPPFLWAIACYHIYRITPYKGRAYRWVIATIILGLLFIRLSIGYGTIWINQSFMRFIVPSESMEPTLQVNDRMFVHNTASYQPQTADIVVFTIPESAIDILDASPDTIFVKRMIGLPGQTVQISKGNVWVDGTPLNEPYLKSLPDYEWGPVTIPPNEYVVLGDNRQESADSHIWGFLSGENILGKAYKIYWPPNRIQPLSFVE